MRVTLDGVSKGRRGQALPEISLEFIDGQARIAQAETEQRPAVLGLLATGRMKPDTGTVLIDGRADNDALRRHVALVDAPDVNDPAPNVAVFGLVAEELMFAGRPSHPVAVRRWLADADMRELSRVPIADVSPRERLRLLLELTSLRAGVGAMVLVSPQRHGGLPEEWWDLAEEFAGRGFGVLVIAGADSTAQLADRAPRAERESAITADAADAEQETSDGVDAEPPAAAETERPADDAPADQVEGPEQADAPEPEKAEDEAHDDPPDAAWEHDDEDAADAAASPEPIDQSQSDEEEGR